MARPIGPAIELLNVLDVRLRNALSATHATELDGLVMSSPAWGELRRRPHRARARQWAATIGCRCWSPKATGPVRM